MTENENEDKGEFRLDFTFNVYDESGGRANLSCMYGSLFVVFNDVRMSAYQWCGVVRKGKNKCSRCLIP